MKVRRIDICDFRGFPGPARYEFDLGDAGNVVVYGENGSGKSSLFRAIEEFFNLDSKAKEFGKFKNVFSDQNLTNGTVTVYFDDGTSSVPISWAMGGARQVSDPRVAGSSIRLGCIDYRALLRTNFLHHGDRVNLFSLAVSHLLAHYPVNVRGRSTTIGELWRRVESLKPKNHRGHNREIAHNAVADFNSAFQPIIPTLGTKTEELLARFPGCEFKLLFTSAPVEYDETKRDYKGKTLELEVHFNGVPITSHQHFLNEARLSGIALALYFAGLLISVPPAPPGAPEYPKLLVLDDVLIGLDLANRLPVLQLIEEEFVDKGWQSLLFTFDRPWYEIAKQQLRASHWGHFELFAIRVGDHEQPLLLPDHEHLYRALAFLDEGQVKAAGVHVRTAFETILKRGCQLLGVQVKFHSDPRKVPAADLWGALKSEKYELTPPLQYIFDNKGKIHSWQPKKRQVPVVPPALQKRIEHAVSWVLNPLSHSQPVDRYRLEIEEAIYAIDELGVAVKQAIAPPSASPPIAFEQIISLLKAHNGLSITNGKGRRTGMNDGSGQTAWSFDAAGNVLIKKQTIAGVTNVISFSHNADNSVASISYPSGRTITYGYNNAGRPVSAVDSANGLNYATQVTYASIGTPAAVLHGSTGTFGGITESYSYNNRLQMTGIVASSSNGTAFNIANSYAQTAGNNGNLTSVTNSLDSGRNLTAGYDYLNRISTAQTQATSGADCWGLNFGDDFVANLLSETVSKCSAYSLSVSVNTKNQISSSGFVYDLSGNLTADGTYSYSYNAENQLTSAAGVTYTYDGDGLRVKKTAGTLYWRGVSGQTLVETDLSGNLQNEYIYFLGRRIARRNGSGTVYYYFTDQLGSIRTITDAQGNKCYDTDYYPYGFESGPFTNTCPQNYKFTGFERDPETGLDYAFARYYNPRLGRFMSPDKRLGNIGNPQSLNRYAYALNNPLNLADGSGSYPQDRHLYVTYLLAMLAGWPDGTSWWLATQTAAQDDFTHATTGLLGFGAIINFSGHFGVPCNQGPTPCSFAGALFSGANAGAQAHLIEDNSPNGPHQIVAGNGLGARIGSELLHILLPIIGKNPDTDSSRLGGWLGLWTYLGGKRDTFPGDLISDALDVINSQGLQIVGLQVTINSQTTSHGDKPPICDDDECVIYADTVNGVRLIIYQESGNGTDYWNPAELVGTSVWWDYVTGSGGEFSDANYALAAYLCSIGRCNDY